MKFRILGYVAAIAVVSSAAQAETIRQLAVVKIGEAMGLAAKCSSLELELGEEFRLLSIPPVWP